MNENNYPAAIARRIAKAQAAKSAVDHNGRRIGAEAVFRYDDHGQLLEAERGEDK